MKANRATEYIKWVKDNPGKTCRKVKQAVARFNDMLKKCQPKNSQIYYDPDEPELIISFAEQYLKIMLHDEIQGIKVYPWQAFIIHAIYGFKYKKDHARVVRTAVISTAKKNGKSTFESIPILYDLFSRPGARIYLAALDKDQTKNVFEPVELMLKNSPELFPEVEISNKFKTVVRPESFGAIHTLSKGSENKQGIKPSLAIIDEYYLYRTDDLTNILRYGFRSVQNPLLMIITTNGKDKQTPYYQEYDRCARLLDGVIQDDSTFCIFYEYDKTDKWDDKTALIKANPMLEHTLDYARDFRADLEEARQKPYKQADYMMLTCNVWVDALVDGWIPDEKWKPIIRKLPAQEELDQLPSVLAFDLSKINDFTVLTQYYAGTHARYARHWCYIPEETINQKIEDNISIKTWIDQGFILPTPGATVDYSYISNQIMQQWEIGNCLAVTYDPYQSKFVISYLGDKITTIDFNQGLKNMSQPTKDWEKLVYDKKLIDPNPVMRWMVSCAQIKPDVNGNYKPLKQDTRKANKRIDAVITSIMANSVLTELTSSGGRVQYTYDDIARLIGA